MAIPKDPIIMLSYINTQLRDFYPSLEELCKALDANPQEIISRLAAVNYRYDESKNQFV